MAKKDNVVVAYDSKARIMSRQAIHRMTLKQNKIIGMILSEMKDNRAEVDLFKVKSKLGYKMDSAVFQELNELVSVCYISLGDERNTHIPYFAKLQYDKDKIWAEWSAENAEYVKALKVMQDLYVSSDYLLLKNEHDQIVYEMIIDKLREVQSQQTLLSAQKIKKLNDSGTACTSEQLTAVRARLSDKGIQGFNAMLKLDKIDELTKEQADVIIKNVTNECVIELSYEEMLKLLKPQSDIVGLMPLFPRILSDINLYADNLVLVEETVRPPVQGKYIFTVYRDIRKPSYFTQLDCLLREEIRKALERGKGADVDKFEIAFNHKSLVDALHLPDTKVYSQEHILKSLFNVYKERTARNNTDFKIDAIQEIREDTNVKFVFKLSYKNR